jgi:hypothetical protein
MINGRKFIHYALFTLSIALCTILSVSCVTTKNQNNDEYYPNVSVLTQPKSSDI